MNERGFIEPNNESALRAEIIAPGRVRVDFGRGTMNFAYTKDGRIGQVSKTPHNFEPTAGELEEATQMAENLIVGAHDENDPWSPEIPF